MEGIWDELTASDFWKQGARVTVYPYSEVRSINTNNWRIQGPFSVQFVFHFHAVLGKNIFK